LPVLKNVLVILLGELNKLATGENLDSIIGEAMTLGLDLPLDEEFNPELMELLVPMDFESL
jgi:hypothetical protein